MDSGYYALLTGLLARSQELDTASNNTANTSTKGFRAETAFFRDTILGPNAGDSQLNRALNDYGVVGGD
jgi:flagellar basal-body rod protein FlgF